MINDAIGLINVIAIAGFRFARSVPYIGSRSFDSLLPLIQRGGFLKTNYRVISITQNRHLLLARHS